MAPSRTRRGRELRYYGTVIVRSLWFLILCVLLTSGGTFLVSKLQKPSYRATTLLIVEQDSSSQDPYSSLLASNQLVTTYVSLITQPIVLQKAAQQVKGTTTLSLTSAVQASAQSGTQLIQVQVDDTNPQRAANIANAVASSFIDIQQQTVETKFDDSTRKLYDEYNQVLSQINSLTSRIKTLTANNPNDPTLVSLQQQLTLAQARRTALESLNSQLALQSVSSNSSIRVFQPAIPPISADSPRTLFNTLLGALFGLVLALGVVFLREYVDDRVRTAEQIEKVIGLPTIGTLPLQNKHDTLLSTNSNTPLGDSFRILRTNISFVGFDKPIRSIVVVSAAPNEGKSTIAINLAISLAQSGKRVLLIDADLRRPTIHTSLGVQNVGGLTLALLEGFRKSTAVVVPSIPHLSVLTAGPKPPNPTELLESDRMQQLLHAVQTTGQEQGSVDMVVIDTPPALGFADAAVLAAHADGVIIVANTRISHEGGLIQTRDALKRVNARILGVVLNGVRSRGSNKAYYNEKVGKTEIAAAISASAIPDTPPIAENSSETFRKAVKPLESSSKTSQVEEETTTVLVPVQEDTKADDTSSTVVLPHLVRKKKNR